MPRKTKVQKTGFRVNRKAFGLTYSAPTTADAQPITSWDEILAYMDTLGTGYDYIIGEELHENGKTHWHVYVKFGHVIDSINPRLFDILGVHPNICDGSPGKGWQAYCAKHRVFKSNFYEVSVHATAMALSTPQEAIDLLWQKDTSRMVYASHLAEANILKRFAPVVERVHYYGPFPERFYPPADFDFKSHSLLLTGPPGVGKTQFAGYLLGDHSYVKGTLHGLRPVACVGRPLLFDEIDMLGDDPKYSKEVTDVENGGTVGARYSDIVIPPGIPRVFCHNLVRPFHDPANAVYGRRVHTVSLWPDGYSGP